MSKPREHLPKTGTSSTETLCGEKRSPIIVDLMRDNDPDEFCLRCRHLACADCGGSGFMNKSKAGIYCPCAYGTFTELRNT